ncbi:MAG: ribonuclease H-like domain-containing protein [Treponema sp.]|jgi:uncharacterized protein YprB with RNaseH-like and TPR domain|nr:ribonuclease H-like domain-containing protein [Treponema sp.]
MGQHLRDRLKRIKQSQLEEKAAASADLSVKNFLPDKPNKFSSEWEEAGYKTLRRKVCCNLPGINFEAFSEDINSNALAILVPDLFQCETGINIPCDLLFFDLETSGLGGAGTVAFLAAFGRIVPDRLPQKTLEITQYLLLDFPGENDFLEAALREFLPSAASGAPPLVVSYNGKAFDSQIIKSRCLMKGFAPPVYNHADLLHPCRRLWKNKLDSCSQGVIETEILGLDRSGDVPGSLAPDIWFSFLKSEDPSELMGICDHNLRDVSGLACIFFALAEIAASPLDSLNKYNYDIETLALRLRESLHKAQFSVTGVEAGKAAALLEAAADQNSARVLRVLAIEAEWKEGNFQKALGYTERILTVNEILPALKEETLRRRERLLRKVRV